MKKIAAVLFDLDGTLLDTAPDLGFALNCLRKEEGPAPLPLISYRPIISQGANGLLKHALNIEEDHENYQRVREHFLSYYQKHLADNSRLFPNMETMLSYLNERAIPGGIVTNKYAQYTNALLPALPLPYQPQCLVCGDTLSTYKPNPAPLLFAAELLQQSPENCLYVGDALTDVIASKAAGMQSIVAMYGYLGTEDKPLEWAADGYINDPMEVIAWL